MEPAGGPGGGGGECERSGELLNPAYAAQEGWDPLRGDGAQSVQALLKRSSDCEDGWAIYCIPWTAEVQKTKTPL